MTPTYHTLIFNITHRTVLFIGCNRRKLKHLPDTCGSLALHLLAYGLLGFRSAGSQGNLIRLRWVAPKVTELKLVA